MTDQHNNDSLDDEARPFATLLLEMQSGRTHEELTDNMRDLVARVRDTGKKGTLTLKLTVALLDGNPNIVLTSDDITVAMPKHDRPKTIFYADDNNQLTKNDPRQQSLWGQGTTAMPASPRVDPALRRD